MTRPGFGMSRKIIVDTDPGVDDAMALFTALVSPELDIIGVTTIFGNAATPVTTRNALTLLDIAGRSDIPVAMGRSDPIASDYLGPVPQVHGSDGLGNSHRPPPDRRPVEDSAADFIRTALTAHPGEVTLLALGPLTNLAAALTADPGITDLVADVVVMGGNALVPGNATPAAEANINNDPEAADLVFGAPWPVTMVGLDVTHQVNLSGAAIDRIVTGTSPASRLLAEAIPVYRAFFETTNEIDGIFVHDPSTVAFLIDQDLFTTDDWAIRVETESFSRGKTWPNLGNTDEAAPPAWQGRPLVRVCTGVDAAGVAELVTERLTTGS